MAKSIYDENLYLNGYQKALDFFNEKRNSFMTCYALELKCYGNIIREYDKLIKKTAEFVKTLDYNSPLEYSIAILFLINEGYLSKNMKYRYGTPKNQIIFKQGINIVTGKGNCGHDAAIHKDVFDKLGEYDKKLYCTLGKSHKKAVVKPANHVVNLVRHDDVLYGIDMCNNGLLYGFTDSFALEGIGNPQKVIYKPYFGYMNGDETFSEIESDIKMFAEEAKKNHITPREYWDGIVKPVLLYLLENEDLLMDFNNETKELKDNIYEGMELKRQRKPQLTKPE